MIDSLSWFINILNTVIGIAGTVVLAFSAFLMSLLLKNLSSKSSRILSYFAALILTVALFKEIAAHNIIIFAYKSLLIAYFTYKLTQVGRGLVQRMLMGAKMIRAKSPNEHNGSRSFLNNAVFYTANPLGRFSPSVLKVSTVLIQ
jgi:CBS domain containing-hemolysin-like protein